MISLSRGFDGQGKLIWVLCPICFEANEPVSARTGGMLSTIDGDVTDVCVDCNAKEYLVLAAMMGA